MANGIMQKFTDRKMEELVILYTSGEKITDIALKMNVCRQTIYDWLAKEETKASLDKHRRYLERQGNEIILKELNTYIDNIKKLANQQEDKRSALSANQYLIDRIYGKTTAKIELEASSKPQDYIDDDIIDAELNNVDVDM